MHSDKKAYCPLTSFFLNPLTEKDPQEQCKGHMFDRILLDRILLALSVTGLFIVMILCIGALIVRRKRVSEMGDKWTCPQKHAAVLQ